MLEIFPSSSMTPSRCVMKLSAMSHMGVTKLPTLLGTTCLDAALLVLFHSASDLDVYWKYTKHSHNIQGGGITTLHLIDTEIAKLVLSKPSLAETTWPFAITAIMFALNTFFLKLKQQANSWKLLALDINRQEP